MKSFPISQNRNSSSLPTVPAPAIWFSAGFRALLLLVAAIAALSTLAAAQTGNGDFTIVAMPDTQYYSQSYPQIYNSQTQWIANNLSSLNIKLVVGLGDIVEGGGVITEWQTADAAVRTLDGKVPYLMAIGNHDYDKNDPGNRTASTTNFNAYFGPSRYSGYSYYRGSFPAGSNENFYGVLNINGKNYLILMLEFYPRSASLAWAASVVQANPDKEVIVVTHSYEYFDNTRVALCDNFNAEYYGLGADNDGDAMWQKFVSQYPNISLVLSGHLVKGAGQDAVGSRADLGIHGNLVNQILSNYQDLVNGGDGYLRILKFRPSLNVIEVSTYSPYENLWKTDAVNQFTVPWHNPGTAATTGNIVGRVKNANTCSSLAGVTVSYPGGSTLTDTYGRYSLINVPAGTYVVTAQGTGFGPVANPVTVNAGYSAELKIFMGAAAAAGSITGHVTSNGFPLSGATVSYSGGATQTNSSGAYTLANIPPGTYNVTAQKHKFHPQSSTVTVTSSGTTTLDFSLQKH